MTGMTDESATARPLVPRTARSSSWRHHASSGINDHAVLGQGFQQLGGGGHDLGHVGRVGVLGQVADVQLGQQDDPVGDAAGQLERLRSCRQHPDRDVGPGRYPGAESAALTRSFQMIDAGPRPDARVGAPC
jgi:hypothetical protein